MGTVISRYVELVIIYERTDNSLHITSIPPDFCCVGGSDIEDFWFFPGTSGGSMDDSLGEKTLIHTSCTSWGCLAHPRSQDQEIGLFCTMANVKNNTLSHGE